MHIRMYVYVLLTLTHMYIYACICTPDPDTYVCYPTYTPGPNTCIGSSKWDRRISAPRDMAARQLQRTALASAASGDDDDADDERVPYSRTRWTVEGEQVPQVESEEQVPEESEEY